jgi:hypothetical protein
VHVIQWMEIFLFSIGIIKMSNELKIIYKWMFGEQAQASSIKRDDKYTIILTKRYLVDSFRAVVVLQ